MLASLYVSHIILLPSMVCQGEAVTDDNVYTLTRFLHFSGLVLHYQQEVPKWTGGSFVPTELDIMRAGARDPRGLKYIPSNTIPGYGSGTRPVAQSGALLATVFLQV